MEIMKLDRPDNDGLMEHRPGGEVPFAESKPCIWKRYSRLTKGPEGFRPFAASPGHP